MAETTVETLPPLSFVDQALLAGTVERLGSRELIHNGDLLAHNLEEFIEAFGTPRDRTGHPEIQRALMEIVARALIDTIETTPTGPEQGDYAGRADYPLLVLESVFKGEDAARANVPGYRSPFSRESLVDARLAVQRRIVERSIIRPPEPQNMSEARLTSVTALSTNLAMPINGQTKQEDLQQFKANTHVLLDPELTTASGLEYYRYTLAPLMRNKILAVVDEIREDEAIPLEEKEQRIETYVQEQQREEDPNKRWVEGYEWKAEDWREVVMEWLNRQRGPAIERAGPVETREAQQDEGRAPDEDDGLTSR